MNDPMSNLINGLPPAPAQPNDFSDVFTPQPSFGVPQPQQQQPQYQPPQPAPAWQQPAPQPYQQPQYQQQPPQYQQPFIPAVPQLPSQQASQEPEWAKQLRESIEQSQQQPQAPQQGTFDPEKPWNDSNKPTSWEEMQQANLKLASKQAEQIIQQQEAKRQQDAQQAQQFSQEVNQSFTKLRLTGLLPPVTNPTDENDPGKKSEAELLGFTIAMGGKSAEDVTMAAQTLAQQHAQGKYFDPQKNEMVTRPGYQAAAFAPIAGGAPVMGSFGSGSGGITYGQMAASNDLSALMQQAMSVTQ